MLASRSVKTKNLKSEKRGNEMRKQKGFSLIELLIVVAIILIIAAIAIPNLLRARIAANESSAASGIRTINTGEISYFSQFQTYSPLLTNLGPGGPTTACPAPPTAAASCFIDGVLASNGNPAGGGKNGYTYAAAGTATTYNATASAVTLNTTGVRGFCSIEDAVVRFQNPGPIAAGACAATIAPLQ
jgi:type IV pilus assembly protein PilA